MTNSPMLDYEPQQVRRHFGAQVVFWLSLVSAALFCLVLPSVLVLMAAIGVHLHAQRHPETDGVWYAHRAVAISFIASVAGFAFLVLMPCGCHSRELSNRSVCAANLRGLTQCLLVYAADNGGAFPSVHYAAFSPALNDAKANLAGTDPAGVLANYYASGQQAGSPQAILWQLVLRGDASAKSFICKSDNFATVPAAMDDHGKCFDNFQDGHQLSYSVAYPWKSDGTLGGWWKETSDADLPLMAEMAPEQGTGKPPCDVLALKKQSNSTNHQGDGQNVAFGDAHVEFCRLPNVGHDGDNIYAWRPKGAAKEVPAEKVSPVLTADKRPFDIVMYPIRNETTGGF